MGPLRILIPVVLVVITMSGTLATAQFRFDRGQDVSPTFDGWERNPNGTYTFYFGYFNRNASEEIDIPVGPDNTMDGGPDRGQPTHFYAGPGRQWWVFRIVVPKDWPKEQRLVWTLRHRGRVNQAKAWLQPEWEVDADLIARNGRDAFLFSVSGDVSIDMSNRAPTISGPASQSVALTEAATLTVTAVDDGRPAPPPAAPQGRARPSGLRFRWTVYRAPGKVHFDPETIGPFPTAPAKAETKVTFSAPGNYRLRAIASDGQLFSTHDVDVTVLPRATARAER